MTPGQVQPLPRRVEQRAQEILLVLQTGHGRPVYRFIWTWVFGPLLLLYAYGTVASLFWGTSIAGGTIGQALMRLPPSLVMLLVVLWALVFYRLRPRDEHPDTLVSLVRFWRQNAAERITVWDLNHEGLNWTLSAPAETGLPGVPPPKWFPGVQVEIAPHCPRCGLGITEDRFEAGYYRVCRTCNLRRLSRESLEQSRAEILRIAEQAWRLIHTRRDRAAQL